jgi:hypothetical protein
MVPVLRFLGIIHGFNVLEGLNVSKLIEIKFSRFQGFKIAGFLVFKFQGSGF